MRGLLFGLWHYLRTLAGTLVGLGFTLSAVISILKFTPRQWQDNLGQWYQWVQGLNPYLIAACVTIFCLAALSGAYRHSTAQVDALRRRETRDLLRPIEMFVEEHPAASSVIYASYIAVSILVGSLTIVNSLKGSQTVDTIIVLVALVAVASLLDYGHVRLLANRHREILKRDRHLAALQRFVLHATELQKRDYEYELYEWDYVIAKNGDGICTRRTVIDPKYGTVFSQMLLCGAIGQSPGVVSAEDLGLVICSRPANQPDATPIPQLFVVQEDILMSKEIAIVLDPPAYREKPAHMVTAEHRWPGLWVALVTKGEDRGRVRVQHEIHNFRLTIQAPPGFKLTRFRFNPSENRGSHLIEEHEGKYRVVWTAKDVPKGDISYIIEGEWLKEETAQ